jgi:hypothetical protein
VPGLVLSLGVKNANPIQEAFEFTWPGLVFLVMTWRLYVVNRVIQLPILVLTLGGAGLISVAQFHILLLSGVEGCLLGQSIFVGNCQHLRIHLGILHGELASQE